MLKFAAKFAKNENGAMSVEYAVTGAVISVGAVKSLHCITVYCLIPQFSGLSGVLS